MTRLLTVCLLLALPLGAAETTNKRLATTDEAKAGPDWRVQGEYLGTLADGKPLAAQVMALGDGEFQLALLPGGLPGAGWDGKAWTKALGKTKGEETTFEGVGLEAVQRGEQLTGKTAKDATFTLKKTVRTSPTLGAKPPAGAVVLFDGSNLDAWAKGKMDDAQNLLAASGPTTKDAWQNFRLHLEFRTAYMPFARSNARSNSGVYLQRRYEMQIIDSFGLFDPKSKNGDVCGELYRSVDPKLNACLPPLTWQTYDIELRAPTFDGTKKTANARLTARLNGLVIHDDLEVPNKTGAGQPEGPQALPLFLQDHGAQVWFRNVWLVPLP